MNAIHTISAKRRAELAALHNTNADYLYQCLTGRRDMAPEEAMRLETATGGELHRLMLCQKRAHLIWPELAAPQEPQP
jgi:DNA-binding transcriptional regulator YdaS (Cro superfamily)